MLKHLNDPIPLPRARNPLLSEDVERVILKALAKDPTDRYQTAGDLAQALQQSLSAAPAAVSPPRPARWTQKPGIWLGALAVLLILAGGIVGALVAGRIGGGALAPTAQPLTPVPTAIPATPLPTVAPLPTRPSTPQPSQTAEPGGMISILQHLPAPGYLAEGITWDGTDLWISDNSGTIFQVDPAGRTLNALPAPEVTPMGLAWDGSSLWLFTTNYGFIYQFQFEGPQARTIQSFQSPARVFGGGISHDRDPPSLLVEFKIERQMETGSQTVQGEVPIAASSGEWPTLSLALLISEDGGRLRLRVPGAGEIDLGEPTEDIQGQIGDSLLPGNLA